MRRGLQLFSISLALIACFCTMKPLVMRPRWVPEVTVNPAMAGASVARPLKLTKLTDSRGLEDLSLIGQNVQEAPVPVRSTVSIEDFATTALETCLRDWGVRLSPNAELVLRGEIVTLFVTEGNKYNAEARIRFLLENSAGTQLWEGIAAGDDFTWGSDMNPENYELALSNALKKAYAALLSDSGFKKAWAEAPIKAEPQGL